MAQIPAGTNRPGQLSRKETGDAWELKARRWLEGKGLRFTAASGRGGGGKIDRTMKEGRPMLLVEVPYRHSPRFGGPAASVPPAKQHKLLQTAHLWLARHNGSFDTVDCRFDVLAFTGNEIEWLKNAFGEDA